MGNQFSFFHMLTLLNNFKTVVCVLSRARFFRKLACNTGCFSIRSKTKMSKKSSLSEIQVYTSDENSCSDKETNQENLFKKENDKKSIHSELSNEESIEVQEFIQTPSSNESILKKYFEKKRRKFCEQLIESDSDESPKIQQFSPNASSKKSVNKKKRKKFFEQLSASDSDESPEIEQLLPNESSKKSVIEKNLSDEYQKSSNICKKMNKTPSLKRTYSMTENDFSTVNKVKNEESDGLSRISSIFKHDRRSLPTGSTEALSETPKRLTVLNNISRRRSYPHKLTPQSSKQNFHRNFTTDQTPYSPKDSYQQRKRFRSLLPSYNSSDLITFESDEGFIDSHCHLDFLFQRQYYEGSYKDYRKKHADTFPKCYKGCLAIFCNPFTFSEEHKWKSYIEEENVWASFGCHPHNAKDYNDQIEDSLRHALDHPKVRALGEIGLDYSSRNYCMRDLQHEAFKRQLKIALEKKLPLVIHCREAHEDGLAIMKKIVPKDYFIHLHCFTDTWDRASQWLQEFPNLFIGLTNVVTFPSAENVHEVAKKIPLQRLLIETDAPYFLPKPLLREYPETRFSHPGMAIHVAAQIAALKEMNLELILHNVRQNTKKMYKI